MKLIHLIMARLHRGTPLSPPFSTSTNAWTLADSGNGIANITDVRGGVVATFTRASQAATRLASGLWRLDVPNNTARAYYDENLVYQGYLVEPAATQLITAGDVRDMAGANWVKTSITVVKNAVGIDGVASAANTLTASANNATALFTLTAAASSRTYSAFVRRKTGTGAVILKHGATTLDITALINSTSYTQVQLNATQLNAALGFEISVSGDAIEVDCNQFEAGTKATTPIPSTGSRADDVLATNKTINTGSLYIGWTPFNIGTNAGMLLGSSHTAGTAVFVRAQTATTMVFNSLGGVQTTTVTARTNGTAYKSAQGFDAATLTYTENGVSTSKPFDGSFDNYFMAIGCRTGTTNAPFHGTIKDVYYWEANRLSDIVLAGMTGTIPMPTMHSVTTANVNEGEVAKFTVTLSNAYYTDLSFAFSVSGTATAGVDYSATPTLTNGCTIGGGNITFPAGVSTTEIAFTTLDNGTRTGLLTLGSTAGGQSATAKIYDTDGNGDSISTYTGASLEPINTTTTDTININDYVTGTVVITPPASGTFTKTIHKAGGLNSDVFSKSRIGYVTLNNTSSQTIKIGSANLSLSQQHMIGVLFRMDTSQLGGYNGEFELLKTTQTGGLGNRLLRVGIGGFTSSNEAIRKQIFMQREGVSALQYELSPTSAAYPIAIAPDYFNANSPFANAANGKWMWAWVIGTSNDAGYFRPENLSANYSTTQGKNSIIIAQGLHMDAPNFAAMSCLPSTNPSWANISPMTLSNVDFIVGSGSTGTGKTIDIARVIKINSFAGFDAIGAMSSGIHPKQLGLMTGDDFCLDFGSLQAGCTETSSPTYNTAEDGAIVHRYHGDTSSDVTVSVVNKRVI